LGASHKQDKPARRRRWRRRLGGRGLRLMCLQFWGRLALWCRSCQGSREGIRWCRHSSDREEDYSFSLWTI
jgi:hypothetical protein